MNKALQWIGVVALVVACLALGFFVGRGARPQPPVVQTDTLVVRDTIREAFPVYVDREVVRTELVPVTDTLYRHDTLFVALEIERRTYEGEDYRAVVSGWQPSLDEIAVYPTTTYITKEVQVPGPAPRWSFGVTAGPGILYDGKLHGGVGIVAGLQYRF